MRYFETRFLEEADEFIRGLSQKTVKKILYNIDLAAGLQVRLLAFWDKTDKKETLVIATHGFIKKVDKVAGKEIERAIKLRLKYFEGR